MDPNANLARQREIVAEVNRLEQQYTGAEARGLDPDALWEEIHNDLACLAEYVTAMDEWLSGGGFLPDDWQRATPGGSIRWADGKVTTPNWTGA